jgi:hypothetical protein
MPVAEIEFKISFGRLDVSKTQDKAKLAQVKLMLAAKCERLMKTAKSKPKKKTLTHQADKHRRQAADLTR